MQPSSTPAASPSSATPARVISPSALLEHWQGHRRLTRRVIETFPEDQLFRFSIGGMRPFSAMAFEIISVAFHGIEGIATGTWTRAEDLPHRSGSGAPPTREALLDLWDRTTERIEERWPTISPQRFGEVAKAFGIHEGVVHDVLLYFIDNEIHHRGQGYVYLRALGIDAPSFYDRR